MGTSSIQAAGNVENSGAVATNGGNNLNAGNISIQAGGNVNLNSGSVISASGKGQNSNGGDISIKGAGNGELSSGAVVEASGGNVSGNGGTVDFSAKGTVNLDGGVLKAGAVNGTAGTVTLDPTNLTVSANDTPNDGTNLDFTADNSITVAPGVTISSRQIGSGTSQVTSPSTGNSGNISFEAPQITVGNGAFILANATNGYTSGNIAMTADSSSSAAQAVAQAGIAIGNATLSAGDITLKATSDATADNTVNSYVQSALNDALLGFLVTGPAATDTSSATSSITIGNPNAAGQATLSAGGDVSINSAATSDTKENIVGAPQGVAYGKSDATATATVGSNASITAGGKFDLSTKSTDHLELLSQTGSTSPANVAVSYGKADSTSNAEIAGQVTADEIKIDAENENKFATEAKGFNNTGGGTSAAGIGVALGYYKSSATTSVPGSLTAKGGNVDISSSSTNEENATRSESEVTDQTDLGKIENQTVPFLGTLSQFIQSHSKTKSEANPNQFGLAASVSYMSSSNMASSNVSGSVTADQGAVGIDATATDNPKISAAGSSDGANLSVGGGVAIGNFKNEADATVTGNALITAANNVEVNADAEIPNPVTTGFDELAKGFDGFTGVDFSNSVINQKGTGWGQSLWTDLQTLYNGVKGVQADVINPGAFFTSFTNSGLSAEGSGTAGLAGSVDLTSVTNQADAHIAGAAQVTSDTGEVKVNATSNATMINVAGMAFSLNSVLDLNPGVTAGSSLGGSYAGITLNNSSKAYIGDGTHVTATDGSVNVGSDTKSFVLDVVQSGDKAEKFGITGAFDWLHANDSSEAYIQTDATVKAGQDVNVNATNNLSDFVVDGALGMGGTVQVGVTTGWNQIDNTTLAYIGDPSNSRTSICAGCGVTAGGNVNVEAKSKEDVYAISLAAAKSGSSGEGADGESSSQPTGETAPSNSGSGTEGDNGAGGGGYGFGISANIAFNQINNGAGGPGVTTEAFINNGAKVNATGDINLNASDTSFVVAAGVAATLGQNAALAGAYSQNSFIKQVEAYTENSTLGAKGLNVTANDQGDLFDISAGGGVNTEAGIALAGSVNNNSITNTTEAYLGSGTTATGIGSDGITLSADEGSASGGDKIVSVAGGFGIGTDGSGIGAGIDLGNYKNNVTASIENGADAGSSGNAQLTANTNIFMLPIAVTFGFGDNFGAAGSFAYEQLTNNTTASIDGTLATGSNLLIGSNDTSNVGIVAGGVGVGGDAGVGVTGVIPAINRTTTASIGNNANVTALGSDSLPLTYDNQTFVGTLLDATASGSLTDFSIAGGGGGVVGVAGAVILNPFFQSNTDTLNDDTEATIGNNATVNGNNGGAASDQSVMLEAKDSTGIMDVAGALSLAGTGAVGVGFDQVNPVWTVKTGIGSGATVNAADNVVTSSTLDNSLQSYALAASGSADEVSVSGAGAASVLNVTTNTDSYINGNVLAGGNVAVAANRNTSSLNALDGDAAVAISLGGGVGVSVGKITTNDTVDASIGGTGNVTALGNGTALNVPNGQLDGSGNPMLSPFHGVSVTAMSNTSSTPIAAGLAASGVFGGQGSVLVNSFTETTKAHIHSGAQVNVNADNGANADQSVQALATGDMSLTSTAGAVGGGLAALAGGVDTETLNRTVNADISGATVNAADNVLVDGSMLGSMTSIAFAGSAGGFAGDGAVSVINETTNTGGYISGGANVTAGGNVGVLANRNTSLTTGDGSAALSGEASANGSVSTVTKNDTVGAYVGPNTSVTALGQGAGLTVPVDNSGSLTTATLNGLSVDATAQEALKTIAIGAAISGGVGLTGSATTNNITENTSARIEGGATINGTNAGAASGQGVNVLASDDTTLTSADGTAALASGAGIGAAVDFGNIQKTTTAGIDNGANVNALGAVNVDALSSETINSYEAAVGGALGAGVAGTTADYSTNPIKTTTKAYVGSCTSSSNCSGGATVNAGSLGVDANDSLTFKTITGELAVGGGAGLGAGTFEVVADGNTSAYIGADSNIITQSGGVNVNSNFSDNLSGTALAGTGSALASGAAAYASITDNSNNSAYISDGVYIQSAGNVGVTAKTTRNLSATTGALSVGSIAAGAVITRTSASGNTQGTIGNNANITAAGLNVSADDNGTVSSTGTAISAGIGSGQYNQSKADLGGAVTASIGNSANINVANNLSVAASGESDSSATVNGGNYGGVTVGVAESEASATPTISASIGNNEAINAGHDLSLEASYTSSGVSASGTMSSGSLANVGVSTSYAHANNSPTVTAKVGDGSSTVSAGHNLTISSTSNANASATFNGDAFSGVNIPGASEATANINNTNQVLIGSGVDLSAGYDLLLKALTSNVIPKATVTGTNAGLISISDNTNGSTANACIDSPSSCSDSGSNGGTSVTVDSGASLSAGNSAALDALSGDSANDVNSTTTVISGIGTNNNNANVTIEDSPSVPVTDASINAPTVTLEAEINQMLVSAEADSVTAAADSTSEATSKVNVTADPGVFLTGASVTGPKEISITSSVSSDSSQVDTKNKATADINGFTGSIVANATNNTTYDPTASIDSASTLKTDNLQVNVSSPVVPSGGSNPYYSNNADAQNNTVVSWVLTTFQEVVNEIFGWIPGLGNLVKQVTKTVTQWVEKVTNSSTSNNVYGSFTSAPSVNINGTIYQPAGQNPVLVADPNGSGGVSFTTDVNVPASVSGNNIVVGNLTNNLTSTININAPNGTVSGNFTVHRNTSWTNVSITNNTGDNLILNGIQPIASNGTTPDISVTAGDSSGLSYNFVTDNTTSNIMVQNNSGSNVTFDGFIDNPSGALAATNTGGNIFSGPDGLFLLNQLSLNANNGSIGSAGSYLNAEMETGNGMNATLSAQAGGNLYLNATQVENVPSGTALPGDTLQGALNITSIKTGGDTNLNLETPTLLVNSVDPTTGVRTVTPEAALGTYNLDSLQAGGNANLYVSGAPLNLYDLLQAGGSANITDLGYGIFNAGSGQLIRANSINLNAVNGTIGSSSTPVNVDLTGGSVNANALVSVYLNAPSGNLPVGTIAASEGNVGLTAPDGNVEVGSVNAPGSIGAPNSGTVGIVASGSILDADNSGTTDINAQHINLLAGGAIGTDANALDIVTPNALNSLSGLNTNITENAGDFNIGTVTSTAGNVKLTALNGNVNLGTVNAKQGTATIFAENSILDGDAAAGTSDINANSINLTATTGTLGTDANPLQIDSSFSAPGLVNGYAAGDVILNEVSGPLDVGAITSTAGNVNLTAPDGDVNLGTISSTSGNTTITALDSILNDSAGVNPNISAININLAAQNGSIGTDSTPVTIVSSDATPGALTSDSHGNTNITQVSGTLNVNTATSETGNVTLKASAGDIVLGTVNAKVGTASLTSQDSILDGDGAAGASDINANNINLTATTGTIGTDANPLQINSSFSTPGLVNGLAEGDVNLNEVAGSFNVGTISSTAGNVNLTAPDGDVNLGTVNSTAGTTNITALNSILNAFGSNPGDANINAISINLNAQSGSIGTSGDMLTINSSDASPGVVNALAKLGIYLDQLQGPLNVDSITSQTGDINILSDGSILNANPSGGANLTGNNITLTSTSGGIGTSATRLVVDNRNPDTITSGTPDGSHYLDMSANGDIYTNEIGGNLLSHSISSATGNIDLLASNGNGNLDNVIGNKNITATVDGSLLNINNLTGSTATSQKMASPNNVSLNVATAGGTLNVNHMDVFQSVTTRADNTNLFNVVHTNLANPQLEADVQAGALHFDDRGATGGIANSININVAPCSGCTAMPAVIFDNYLTQTGNVNASVEWLEFINAIVSNSADVRNNWLDIQLNNKYAGKSSSKADTPWYLFMIGDHTAQSYDPIEFHRTTFLNKGSQPAYAQPYGTIFDDLLTSYGFLP